MMFFKLFFVFFVVGKFNIVVILFKMFYNVIYFVNLKVNGMWNLVNWIIFGDEMFEDYFYNEWN